MPFYSVFVPSVQIYQNLVVGRTVNLGMGYVFQTTGLISEKGRGNRNSANQKQNSHWKLYFWGLGN